MNIIPNVLKFVQFTENFDYEKTHYEALLVDSNEVTLVWPNAGLLNEVIPPCRTIKFTDNVKIRKLPEDILPWKIPKGTYPRKVEILPNNEFISYPEMNVIGIRFVSYEEYNETINNTIKELKEPLESREYSNLWEIEDNPFLKTSLPIPLSTAIEIDSKIAQMVEDLKNGKIVLEGFNGVLPKYKPELMDEALYIVPDYKLEIKGLYLKDECNPFPQVMTNYSNGIYPDRKLSLDIDFEYNFTESIKDKFKKWEDIGLMESRENLSSVLKKIADKKSK